MAFTYFFRDMVSFNAVSEYVFPVLSSKREHKIWDAGCANGSEPYTLAMLLRESMGQFAFRNVKILGTDLNGRFAEVIESGVYSDEETKRIPKDVFDTYFSPADKSGSFVLDPAIRRSVTFKQHDLTSLEPVGDNFGLIVCKNVLLHISPAERIEVLKMFHKSLADGGFLTVEQTQKMPDEALPWFRPVSPAAPVFQKI